MNQPLSLLQRALRKPERIPSYLAPKLKTVYRETESELFRRRHSIERQKQRIHEFVGQQEFALIILDSCRYDAFSTVYPEYFRGDLSKVWSSGHWTGAYVQNTWNEYHDLTYVNAAPVVSEFYFENRGNGPNPEQYFKKVVPVWETGWSDELGTTPAEEVTEAALREIADNDHPRLIAHYIQPHFPYVGDYRLDALDDGYDHIRNRVESEGPKMIEQWVERVKSGSVTVSDVKRAYKSNLEYVLGDVCRLVNALDCPVVITADHGEHVGRKGRYLHQESSRYTRTVPWFRVESVVGESETDPLDEIQRSDSENGSSVDDDVVKERLADLGYIE